MKTVTSRHNPLVARFRAAARRKSGRDSILLDGRRLIEEALQAGLHVTVAAATRAAADSEAGPLLATLESRGVAVHLVTESVMGAISPMATPSGLAALAARPSAGLADAVSNRPQLLAMPVDVQDPGNLGAIVRAAEGAGATGIVVAGASADPFGWKALRGAMGSVFRLPVAVERDPGAAAAAIQSAGIALVAAVPTGGRPPSELDLARPAAIMIGGEGPGLSANLIERADSIVTIPMRAPVESLNVAVAAALLLFEAARQRSVGSICSQTADRMS
ncbi:MAG: TrmH family RNA methyltransferase [Vicinamibacterales bacterium]